MIYEYTFSAPAYLRLQSTKYAETHPEQYELVAKTIIKGIQKLRKFVESPNERDSVKISLLFNAYTERTLDEWLRKWDQFGFDSLYADSGGLQVVTTGKEATQELKTQVYTTQSHSDFAMCFDEIPCGNIHAQFDTKNNRAMVSNKRYYPEKAEACARKTAQNIREQVEILANLKSSTKVFYIIQGNNEQDMVDWFRYGIEELDAWHWDHIGGLALADTCMGNGPQQSCDMLAAYHRIRKEFSNEYTKDHIHLLGVGSVRRLLPLIHMSEGGFIPQNLRVSFDSTSFSMSYVMGRFQTKNGKSVKGTRNNLIEYFGSVFDFFDEIYREFFPNVDLQEVLEHLLDKDVADLGDKRGRNMSVSSTINDADPAMSALVRANVSLCNCYQIIGFTKQIIDAIDTIQNISNNSKMIKSREDMALYHLKNIKTFNEYQDWKAVNHLWYSIDSKRIKRGDDNDINSHFN